MLSKWNQNPSSGESLSDSSSTHIPPPSITIQQTPKIPRSRPESPGILFSSLLNSSFLQAPALPTFPSLLNTHTTHLCLLSLAWPPNTCEHVEKSKNKRKKTQPSKTRLAAALTQGSPCYSHNKSIKPKREQSLLLLPAEGHEINCVPCVLEQGGCSPPAWP